VHGMGQLGLCQVTLFLRIAPLYVVRVAKAAFQLAEHVRHKWTIYYYAINDSGVQLGASTWERPPELPEGWRCVYDSSGRFYYYAIDNAGAQQGVSTWQQPPELPAGWRSAWDASVGQFFFFMVSNHGVQQGDATWVRPSALQFELPGDAFNFPDVQRALEDVRQEGPIVPFSAWHQRGATLTDIGATTILYHATRESNAWNICAQRHMFPGRKGFLGPGIYFSQSPANARRHCQCRTGSGPIVVLCCHVDLGNAKTVDRGHHDEQELLASGFNSFKESGRDCYMLPNNNAHRIRMDTVHICQGLL